MNRKTKNNFKCVLLLLEEKKTFVPPTKTLFCFIDEKTLKLFLVKNLTNLFLCCDLLSSYHVK